ncbi:MAG: hypothetical protein XE10_0789 [Methanoculleus marisnigri]|uniref:Uncharacterized protein n=1 Tax=Methanoculleus marisnigri TaxID=2198 RepID=A0A101IVI9_9EURY|nr:hypothetical protein [Methanoculleus marisnigri]KUK63071.1 MAG: hypothetical protein XD82_0532 [Methanoculleus marisnigri]KUL02144.1 MAG: hypothetical protein XE10_0789 [Methanoculleus marisnigri]
MDWLLIILTVAGLVVFETVSSIDNAIINADVLATMGEKARRWFLLSRGVEGAEREDPGLQAGDESGAPSS